MFQQYGIINQNIFSIFIHTTIHRSEHKGALTFQTNNESTEPNIEISTSSDPKRLKNIILISVKLQPSHKFLITCPSNAASQTQQLQMTLKKTKFLKFQRVKYRYYHNQ
jgi:hypothetical protein